MNEANFILKPGRDSYWDVWKGVAIIAVILIHTTSELCSTTVIGLIFRQFIDFPVFLFIALAGYFAGEVKPGETAKYIRHKFERLLPPFLLASVLYAIAKCFLAKEVSLSGIIRRLPDFSCGFGYFVVALLFLFLIAPFFNRIKSAGFRLVASALLSLLSAVVVYILVWRNWCQKMVPVPVPAIFFTTWIFAFTLGCVLKDRRFDAGVGKKRIWVLFVALAAASLLAVAEAFFWAKYGSIKIALAQLKLSTLLQSALLFILLCACHQGKSSIKNNELLAFLGRNSYFIYLYHWFFIVFCRKVLAYFSIGVAAGSFVLPIAVVFFSAIAAYWLRKIGGRVTAYWSGLQ